eukprot:gene27066-biopygen853
MKPLIAFDFVRPGAGRSQFQKYILDIWFDMEPTLDIQCPLPAIYGKNNKALPVQHFLPFMVGIIDYTNRDRSMKSYHEAGVRDRNRLPIPREHPPRDMSSSETGHCDGGIDVWQWKHLLTWSAEQSFTKGSETPNRRTNILPRTVSVLWGVRYFQESG